MDGYCIYIYWPSIGESLVLLHNIAYVYIQYGNFSKTEQKAAKSYFMCHVWMLTVGVVSILYPCPLVAMKLHTWMPGRGGCHGNDLRQRLLCTSVSVWILLISSHHQIFHKPQHLWWWESCETIYDLDKHVETFLFHTIEAWLRSGWTM